MRKTIFSYAILAAVGVLALGFNPTVASAATASTTFQVTATVQSTCLISAAPLAFGTYTGVVNSTSSNLTVTCTSTTPYNVGLDAGTASGATVSNRSMLDASSNKLNYKLSKDSGNTTNWGNTVGTDTAAGTGSGSAQTMTVYGQIPAGQYVKPGSYSDTITATLTY